MNDTSPSRRLRAKMELAQPVLRQHAEQLWSHPRVVDLYPVYLRTMHTVVRAAVPLMETARQRAEDLGPRDPVAAGLERYLAHHVDEERGHDQWLLEDLAVTGADPAEAWLRIPTATVASLVGAQYYWIQHHHPVALLGHIAAIEGYPPPVGFASRLQALTGYPSRAFRAIAVHEKLDIRHRKELWEAIDSFDLDAGHETLMGISALHTIRLSIDVFAEVSSTAAEPAPTAAAV